VAWNIFQRIKFPAKHKSFRILADCVYKQQRNSLSISPRRDPRAVFYRCPKFEVPPLRCDRLLEPGSFIWWQASVPGAKGTSASLSSMSSLPGNSDHHRIANLVKIQAASSFAFHEWIRPVVIIIGLHVSSTRTYTMEPLRAAQCIFSESHLASRVVRDVMLATWPVSASHSRTTTLLGKPVVMRYI